jgi:DNA-directed RNA polymerase I subunit RPA2
MGPRKSNTLVCKSDVPGQHVPSYSNKFVDPKTLLRLEHLVAPHIDSFNYFLNSGLQEAINDIPIMEIQLDDGPNVKLQFISASVGHPTKNDDFCDSSKLTPREARERDISYTGSLGVQIKVTTTHQSNENEMSFHCRFGEFPIMVQSDRCHLKGLSPQKLVSLKEEANEVGGYFIQNGIERVVRLLQVPRRNYASAIERSSFKNRGPAYSDKGE